MTSIISQFLAWYYYETIREILKGWRNFLVFTFKYFSLPVLLKTFFSPWHKYFYSYGRGFSFKKYLNAFTFNMMSRVIGAFLRTFLILAGFLAEIVVFIAGVLMLVVWIILPFLLLFFLLFGLKLILFNV